MATTTVEISRNVPIPPSRRMVYGPLYSLEVGECCDFVGPNYGSLQATKTHLRTRHQKLFTMRTLPGVTPRTVRVWRVK